jgi:hypothetical protein
MIPLVRAPCLEKIRRRTSYFSISQDDQFSGGQRATTSGYVFSETERLRFSRGSVLFKKGLDHPGFRRSTTGPHTGSRPRGSSRLRLDLVSGQVVALLRFDTAVQEVFAVTVLPGRR